MAEVIGILASGISIAQIAGHVASSIAKIKDYWDQVKAAPEDISRLLREVDSFSLILQHIRDDLTRNAIPELVFDNSCVQQSLELCRGGAAELEELANDLAEKLDRKSGSRRKIGAIRTVLKQDDIRRLKRRLKNAIRLLSLAYQCHTSAMIRLQPDIIVAKLSTALITPSRSTTEPDGVTTISFKTHVAQTSRSNSNDLVTQYHSYWAASPSWLKLLLGSLEYHQRNSRHRGRNHQILRARYELPKLISTKVWDFARHRSLSDWSVNIRTYRIIPVDAPILKAIECGDVLRVQSLLTSQAAFVTDRDEWGATLLHRAAEDGMVDLCKLLISEGADVCDSDFHDYTPLEHLSINTGRPPFHKSKDLHEKSTRLLVDAGACNGLICETDALLDFRGDKNVFRYLQQQVYPPYYELPMDQRIRVAQSMDFRWPNAADLTQMALTPGQFSKEVVTFADEDEYTVLHCVTDVFARYCCWFNRNPHLIDAYNKSNNNNRGYEDIEEPNNSWRRLIKDIITAGALLHAVNCDRRSILGNIIWTICSNQYIQDKTLFIGILQVLNIWLLDLQEAGVDLARYGSYEKALHLTGTVNNTFKCLYKLDDETFVDLVSFSYGPRLGDWYFWFSEPTDIFAGEFWAMVEISKCQYDFELPISGSWIENY